MPEYIAKETLEAEIRRQMDECNPMGEGRFYGASFLATVECAPAADVAPVVHGRWIDRCVRDWHCSECDCDIQKVRNCDGYVYKDLPNY